MILFFFYQALLYFLTPFLKFWTYFRLLRGKEDRLRFHERFGRTRLARPNGKIFWFHGASNGECLSFLSLIKRYQELMPEAHFLITSQTLTSAELLKAKMPKRAMHQFLPIDHPWFVKRFLKHWKPDIAFWTESELWPTIIHQATKKSPMLLLNGRLSQRTFKIWSRFPKIAKGLLSRFKWIFPQSSKDFERFKRLGMQHITHLGNLKFSGRPLDINGEKLKALEESLKKRPVWTASCTHPGEEETVIIAHQRLKKTFNNIVTIVVPRHPHRSDKLRQTWENASLKVAQRSLEEPLLKDTDILLFDITGELGLIYHASSITFMGGSLVGGIGGHNPLEAANLKSVIFKGPYIQNNQEIYELFESQGICKTVTTSEDIFETVSFFLKNPEELKMQAGTTYTLASQQQNILDTLLKKIDQLKVLP